MKVRDRMTRQPVVLAPEDNLRKARRLMEERGLRRFPVIDNGVLVGIVTDRDIRAADIRWAVVQEKRYEDYILDHVLVGGIMTPNPITVHPDTPLTEAAGIILENKIGGLPVLENERLVGMITETDLIRTLTEMLKRPSSS